MIGHAAVGGLHFVGRERELASLTDAALDVANGHSRLVLVRGAAGMGKTTLCEHAAPLLARRGFAVTWGRGWPDGGAPPLWPWTSVLRDLGGDDAAAILDEDGRVGAIDADRFARFAAVADVLRRCASKQPVAIVLDDAHLADAAATLLTRFVVRTLHQTPLLVVVTRRTVGDGPDETRRTLDRARARRHRDRPRGLRRRDHRVDARRARTARRELRPGAGARPAHRRQPVAVESRRRRTGGDRRVPCPRPRDRALARCALAGAPRRRRPGGDPRRRRFARRRRRDGRRRPPGCRRGAGAGVGRRARRARRRPLVVHPRPRAPCGARRAHHQRGDGCPRPCARRGVGRRPPGRCGPACPSHARPPPGAPTTTLDGPSPSVAHAARVLARGFDYERAATLLESAVELVERRPPPDHLEVVLEWADALLVCGRLADARRAYARADELADTRRRSGRPRSRRARPRRGVAERASQRRRSGAGARSTAHRPGGARRRQQRRLPSVCAPGSACASPPRRSTTVPRSPRSSTRSRRPGRPAISPSSPRDCRSPTTRCSRPSTWRPAWVSPMS